ncbi:hypothetical protein BCh11DRAFT_07476 [Burkholderia sp. Ch1-1]|nr:hypothetical protein BCh11DRAFT_07476 [Burkholderia sp. Ch1-1]
MPLMMPMKLNRSRRALAADCRNLAHLIHPSARIMTGAVKDAEAAVRDVFARKPV